MQINPPNPRTKQKRKSTQTNCTITCLYSSHTRAAPPEGSSPAPPAGRRRCCPAAPSDSPCGWRLRSAPPARPRSLMRKQYKQFVTMLRQSARRQKTVGPHTQISDCNEPERSRDEERKQIYSLQIERLHGAHHFCFLSLHTLLRVDLSLGIKIWQDVSAGR